MQNVSGKVVFGRGDGMKITIWKRYSKKHETFVHNHIEDGWVEEDKPQPKSPDFEAQGDGRVVHGVKSGGGWSTGW